jgi:hypothetical protein
MRGSPLLRALLAFIIIGFMGWPLWQLTKPQEVAASTPTPKPATPAATKAIGLHLNFTAVPKSFVIKHLDKEVWKVASPEADMEQQVTLDYPDEGVDLQFHIEWADDAPLSAMRVRLTDPAGDRHEKSVWGKGVVDEVVTFP